MDKQQIMDLWRLSFGDSADFIHLYFDRVYKEENTLTIERMGRVVSVLQMVPYTMTYRGTEISVAYLCGLCTLPSERGKGLMQQLIAEAFQVMQSRGVALAALIPASQRLSEYYRRQGFASTFGYAEEFYARPTQPVQESTLTILPLEGLSLEQLYAYLDRKLRERPCAMLHTMDDFITILRDLHLGGGKLLVAINTDEEAVGMAFVLPPNKTDTLLAEKEPIALEALPLVTELFFDNDRIRDLILQEVTLQHDTPAARYQRPAKANEAHLLGMAQVIDQDRLIRHWIKVHPNSLLTARDLTQLSPEALATQLLTEQGAPSWMSLMLN